MSDSHPHAASGGAGHGHGDVEAHVRRAYVVFGALLVLTGLTVAVSSLHLPTAAAIGLALLIACVKGGLVAGWFMHLVFERRLVLSVLALTVFFFFFLLLLPMWTTGDAPALQAPSSGDGKGAFSEPAAPPAPAAAH